MRHAGSSQMHPWQPGECAEKSKQPLWIVCVYGSERDTTVMRPPRKCVIDLSDV